MAFNFVLVGDAVLDEKYKFFVGEPNVGDLNVTDHENYTLDAIRPGAVGNVASYLALIWQKRLLENANGDETPPLNLKVFFPGGFNDEASNLFAQALNFNCRANVRIKPLVISHSGYSMPRKLLFTDIYGVRYACTIGPSYLPNEGTDLVNEATFWGNLLGSDEHVDSLVLVDHNRGALDTRSYVGLLQNVEANNIYIIVGKKANIVKILQALKQHEKQNITLFCNISQLKTYCQYYNLGSNIASSLRFIKDKHGNSLERMIITVGPAGFFYVDFRDGFDSDFYDFKVSTRGTNSSIIGTGDVFASGFIVAKQLNSNDPLTEAVDAVVNFAVLNDSASWIPYIIIKNGVEEGQLLMQQLQRRMYT